MMGKSNILIGYVCESNPFEDRTAWSGLNYKIRESIENAGYDVVWINCRPNGKISKFFYLWNAFFHGKTIMFEHTRFYFRLRAFAIDRCLVKKCDLLFFPRGAQTMNYFHCDKPFIYYSDATFKLLCNYYWNPLSKWQFHTGNFLESHAILKSRINIRASHWAADSVTKDYGFDARHTYVLGFGANIDDVDIEPVKPFNGKGILNILFSGVDWKRKGAEIAIKTVKELNERGVSACLYLVGIRSVPEAYRNLPYVELVGFLNKSINEQYQKYIEILKKCHLFLLPTRAEAAGIVFGECSAFGIPVYTYDTGGTGDYVFDGENGYRLPLTAGPLEFAEMIISTLSEKKQLALHEGCLRIYRDKLSWDAWSKGFGKIIEHDFCNGNKRKG